MSFASPTGPRGAALSKEAAEVFALGVLGWLVGNDDLRDVFLGATGASEADLRARAGDPDFLISVLDFLMMDDAWVMGCCDTLGASYETPMQAKYALPGGADVSWT